MFSSMDYVYEVYKERSFSKAAANLYISQPSLSANISRTERKVGYPLFDRSTKPLGLTECGRRYIECAEKIRAIEDEFRTYVNDLGGLRTGKLVFGGSSFFSSFVLPPLIAEFSDQYPELDIQLVEAKSMELVKQMMDSKVDFILDNKDLDLKYFDRHQVGTEQLLLVVPRDFVTEPELENQRIPYAAIEDGSFRSDNWPTVDLSNFEGRPFIFLHPYNDTGKRAYQICAEQDFKPEIALELDQQMTAYNVACSGIGITFSGEVLLQRATPSPNVVYYKLKSKKNVRSLYFYWKRGRYISQAMQAFLDSVVYQTRL